MSRPDADPFQDLEAEASVLGGILLDPENTLTQLEAVLTAEDFHHPGHALIFHTMRELAARREPIDVVTLTAELRRRERLSAIGGVQYLGSLSDVFVTSANCAAHARIVRELSRRRQAHRALLEAAHRIHAGEPLEAARAQLAHTLEHTEGPAGLVGADLDPLFETVLARAEGRERPLGTPWPSLDRVLGGLWPGMYVLVGGTGAGKTQLAVQTAVHAAQSGARVLYVALELSRQDLAARVVGAIARVPWSHFLRGSLAVAAVHETIRAAEQTARALPLYTECGPPYGYGVETLASRAWVLRPSLVVLDYLQLCSGRSQEEPRVTVGRVAYVARTLARDLGAAVLVLSSTARTNYAELVCDPVKDPSDMVGLGKESGEIEYAADGVFVLARRKDSQDRRLLVVAKNRHGTLGKIELSWDGTEFLDPTAPFATGIVPL